MLNGDNASFLFLNGDKTVLEVNCEFKENGEIYYWKYEGKYQSKRKLYPCYCEDCGKLRFLPKSKIRKYCKSCTTAMNVKKLIEHRKKVCRGLDGKFTKVKEEVLESMTQK